MNKTTCSCILLIAVALIMLFLLTKKKTKTSSKEGGSITVYGSKECPWTVKQLEQLDDVKKAYTFVDCDSGKCPDFVNGFPTTQLEDGSIVSGFKEF